MNNQEVKDRISQYPMVRPYFGISTGKVNAINRELDKISADTDIVAVHSDDMVFIKRGFDLDIIEAYSDGFNGLVHFPDQVQWNRLVTYPIMHIDYLKFFKYIYNPNYNSLYVDNEQQEVAKKINKYRFIDKQILEHRHYRWGYLPDGSRVDPGALAQPDELSKLNDSDLVNEQDKRKYRDFKNLIIVTSLSPIHANNSNQLTALTSWQRISDCYSMNTFDEIHKLKLMYRDITFIETTRTVQHLFGKPRVSINALLELALVKQKDILLVNSDIILDNLPELKDDGITIFSRYDYADNILDNIKFQAGFDAAFIPHKFINIFPPSIYALGCAWWDYEIPYRVILNNIPLYYPQGKHAFHKIHNTQYSDEEWYHIGAYFQWEFRLNKQLSIEQVATSALANIKSRLRKY